MSDFNSILEKYGQKYGINTNVGTTQGNDYKVGSGEFSDLVSRYNNEYNFLGDVQQNRMRYEDDSGVDGEYINQYLRDHHDYWSEYGAGNDVINHRLGERRDSIDEWLESSLEDGIIDQQYYDEVSRALNEADSYVGLYQGQRDLGNYLSDWEAWYNGSVDALNGMDWSTGRDGSAALFDGMDGFSERDAAAREWLNTYKDQLDPEYYSEVMGYLNGFGGMVDDLRIAYDQNAEYFNHWNTQEAYDISRMSADELRAQMDSIGAAGEDLAIVNDLLASNMPYSREYAEQDGRDMAVYDMVEENREYIANKYGLTFTDDYGANHDQLAALVKQLEEMDSGVAYTTKDGQNVTWQMLLDNRAAAEDLQKRLEEYSQNADWEEKSQMIMQQSDTDSDYTIIYSLSQSSVPYDWETAEAYGYTREEFDAEDQRRRYIESKYGVDLHSGAVEANMALRDLLLETDPGVSKEKDTFDDFRYMTDDERRVLSYIYNTEGRDAALAWHEGREWIYENEAINAINKEGMQYGYEHPLWGTLWHIGANIGGGFEQIGNMVDYAKTGELHQNRAAARAAALTAGTSERVDWNIGNWDAFDFVYQTTVSGADSLVNATLFGPAAEVMLGLSAAASATNDALNRGMSKKQAFWTGITAGTFEAIFEHLSIGELRAMKEVASASGKQIALNIAKSMLTNASEETLTEIANVVYDLIVNGDFSQYETTIRKYEAMGLEPEDAKKKAAIDLGLQVVESGASGALMGLGFGVSGQTGPIIGNAIDAAQYRKLPKTVRNSVKRLQDLGMDRVQAIRTSITLNMSAEAYGEHAAEYMAAFDPKQDPYTYASDFRKAYEIGKNNGNQDYIKQLSLNETQGEIAYKLGQQDQGKTAKVAEERPDVDTEYVVSKDGQTVDTKSGEEIEVTGFKSVGKNAELETKDGSIKAQDVSFATEDEAVLYEVVGRTIGTANMANNVLKAYEQAAKDGMSASDFAAGLQQAYDLGFKGQVAERQLGTYELAGALPVGVRSAAYNQGKRMGDIRAASRDADIRKQGRQAQGKREGRFHFDRKGRTFNAKQETSLKALEALSKAIGVDIYVYESYEEGGKRYFQDRSGGKIAAPNGYYDAKGIHIDLNAGNFGQGTMMFTVAHELTHFIHEWSPVKFRKLANLLIERYAEQGTSVRELIDNQILKAKNNGRTIDREEAFQEVVADSMEAVLVKGDMAKVIAELKQTDKTLAQKIREWFKDLAQKLQAVVDSYKGVSPESTEGRLVAQMDDFIGVLQQAYAEALVDAGDSYRASEGNKKTTQEGGVMYQARPVDKEVVHIKDVIKAASNELDSMEPVAVVSTIDLTKMNTNQRYKWAAEILKSSGYQVDRQNFGVIYFSEKQINTGMNYLNDAGEFAAFAALPKVLKRGKVIHDDNNHKGRNFGTVIIAAPVVINGVRGNMGVALQKTTNTHYHTHRIIMPDGSAFEFKANAVPTPSGDLAKKPIIAATISTASNDTVSQRKPGVNSKSEKMLSDRDSSGAVLTQAQQEYFRDSVVRDKDGRLLVMYHGTPNGGFTKFRSGTYFTQDPEYADVYHSPGASSISSKRSADAPMTYKVYLDIKKPFDTRKPKERKIFMNEFYRKYGTGTPLADSGLPDWIDGMDLQEFIEEMEYDYDGLILDEGAVGGYGDEVKSRGLSYVVFNANQVKSVDNKNPTEDPDIRFSDRDPTAAQTAEALEKQNAKLREDVKELRELLRLQGKVTKQTEFRKSSVDAAVTSLAKEAMAKLDADDRTEMRRMLTDLYKFVASDENLAWEGVAERAGKIADFLQERVNIKPQLSEYQQDVLKYLKGQKIRLSDSQRAEVDKLYGYEHFRKTLFGAGIYISKNGMELDSLWHEASDKSMFPGTFAEDTVEGDQPSELLRIIDAMREADDSDAMQYAYNREFIRQDLIRSIYDSYWRVDNLYTVADKKQKQIEAIRKEHRQRMERIAEDQRNTLDKIRAIRENLLYTVRTDYSKDSYLPVREYANAWKSNRKQALGEFKQIENAFIQLAKDFEKFGREKVNEKAKDQKAFEKAQAEARKQFERELRKEAAKHDKDNKLWTREFERLMKEYDRSGQKIERLEERIEKGKETRAASHQRSVVEKAARDLMQMLSRPTKDAHVPMELQKPLEKFLDSIDFTSAKALAGGEPTIRDVAYTRALQDVKRAIAAQRGAMLSDEERVKKGFDERFALDVPANFIDMIDEHISVINKATEGLDLTTNRVYEMTSDELKDLAFILNTINKAIMEIDRLHMAGAKARVSELANETVREMGRRKGTKTETGSVAMWAMYTPTSAFERMGTAAVQVLNGLKQGQSKLARTAAAVIEFARDTYTNKEVKQWSKEVHDIKLSSGETVKMTTAQIMSFYCLSHREHAKGHLTGGGIRIGNIGEGRWATVQKKHYRLTIEDIAKINGLLTNRERELKVANELQRYMADVGGRLGNEISMARWDYMEMTEKDYFPIKSDSDIHDAKNPDQERANLWGLLNKSFTKALTEGANDAVVVSSIFDVFANHMSEMAEYNAFALPLVDAMKWYNYRDTTKLPNGQIKTVGVKKALNDTLGTSAGKYFIDLMTDVNSSQKGGRYENFFGKLLSRSKGAAVGWNLRVAMQQPTAILRASMYLDPLSLAKGSVRFGSKKLGDEMLKYSGIAQWKDLGYYDLNISRGITEQIKGDDSILDKINDAGMWLPGKMDRWTWTAIWAATKNKVEKDTKLKGEALLQKTAETFEDIVYHTQVADSVLTRSGLMRSKGQTLKEMTSFMAEPTMSINLLMSAFQDYREGVTTGEKAKRALRIAFCGYVLSSVANAFVTSLADAWRDDDEYEEFWEKYIQALLGEKFIDGNLFAELNPIEKIVFVRDIISLVKGYDGPKNAYIELVESAVKLLGNVKKFMEGKGRLTAYGLIYQSLQVLGSFTGAAPANLTREAISIWNNTFGKWNGMMIHRYASKTETKIKKAYMAGALTKEEAQDALVADGMSADDAYFTVKGWETGNESKYDDLYDAALAGGDISDAIAELAEHGVSKKSAKSQLRSRIGTWYTDPDSKIKIDRDQAGSMLKQYLDMDDDEVEALLTKWDMKIDTGYSLESLKQEFLDEMVSADDAIDYLIRYGGMDEEDARQKVDDWAFEAENGYSFDDIRQTYLDKDITAEEAMAVLMERGGKTEDEAERSLELWNFETENGWRYEDRAELYKKGKITADQARTVLMELGGKTKSEANKIIEIWDFEIENGWDYEKRSTLYKGGKITADQLVDALIDLGDYTRKEAKYQVEAYDWEKAGLEGASIKRVETWHEYCQGAGVSKETYLKIVKFSANTKNDVDEDGEPIRYSAMKKVMAEINKLPLSPSQKDALAKAMGWSDRNIRKYKPW